MHWLFFFISQLVACYILEAIIAAPQNAASDKHATILSSTNNINPDGSYEYRLINYTYERVLIICKHNTERLYI